MNILKNCDEMFSDEADKDSNLTLLYPKDKTNTREEVVYRKNGKSVDKIIEFDSQTGSKIRTTHYDYFNDKKIRSIDEYDNETGKKIRTINFVLYKSIDEYDLKTGKKLRTINFNVKDSSKISSIQDYDLETGKIITVSIFKRDGRTVSITKKIDPITDKVTNFINKNAPRIYTESDNSNVHSYDNIKSSDRTKDEDIDILLNDLYNKDSYFESITQ